MNHASTNSEGARHIDAFIDALAARHLRLARLTLVTRTGRGSPPWCHGAPRASSWANRNFVSSSSVAGNTARRGK